MKHALLALPVSCAMAALQPALAQPVVYKCPGPPVLYTDAMTSQEAKEKNCTAVRDVPVTVIPAPARARPAASGAAPAVASTSRGPNERVDPADQRARDNDARRILSDELRREEERLAEMKKEFNNGEPERRGDERNYQKYLDRVADLRSAITRKEGDIAAIRRELSKLPPP